MALQQGGGSYPIKPTFGTAPPKPAPTSADSGTTGESKADFPFTNPVGPDGVQLPAVPGSEQAYIQSFVDAAVGGDDTLQNATGGGGAPVMQIPDTDWAQVFWGSLGLPPDLVNQINDIFKKYPDLTMAQAVAQNVIRTSDWFATTFPGFATGVKNGLFTDETGYRDYVNKLNVISQQYNGRAVTTNEVTGALGEGIDASIFEKRLQANAYLAANQGQLQYELGAFGDQGQATPDQLQAFSRQQVGLDTGLGEQIKAQVDKAVQRMQNIFQGSLAGPAGLTLGPQGLNASGLAGAKNSAATNVGA